MVVNGVRVWQMAARQRLRGGEKRINFTHLAFLCNQPAIQPRLPHIIFVARSAMTHAQWDELCAEMPDNVYLKRMPGSWNTVAQHLVVLRLLRAVLEPFMADYQPILSFDAAPIHLDNAILRLLQNSDIWYVIIPARMTWLLQPLDTHCFMHFKKYLKQHFQDEFGGYAERASIMYMIRLLVRAIRFVIQGRDWSVAWSQNGMNADHNGVSRFILQQMQVATVGPFSTDVPSPAHLAVIWPRNRIFPVDTIMASLIEEHGYNADSEND